MDRRSGASQEPDEVNGSLQGGARVWGDEAEVRIREGALPRTGEERQPTVCHLRAGKSVYGSQETAAQDGVVSAKSVRPPERVSRRDPNSVPGMKEPL